MNTINEWSFNKDMNNTTPEGPFEFQAAVWVSDLSTQERLVALAYGSSYNWKNQDDSKCGIYRIASMTGIGKSQISTYRKSLIEKGWLQTARRFGTSSLTKPTIPAGFSYENEKAKQDELVQSQNNAEKARRNKPSKKDDEIAALKAQLAALQAQTVTDVQEDPEPATEPQKDTQSFGDDEWFTNAELEAQAKAAESRPVVEKPATKTRKKVEKVDPVKQMFDQAKAKKSFEEDFIQTRIAESDNPEKAQALFDDSNWKPELTDKVQRAATAAFAVLGDRVAA